MGGGLCSKNKHTVDLKCRSRIFTVNQAHPAKISGAVLDRSPLAYKFNDEFVLQMADTKKPLVFIGGFRL